MKHGLMPLTITKRPTKIYKYFKYCNNLTPVNKNNYLLSNKSNKKWEGNKYKFNKLEVLYSYKIMFFCRQSPNIVITERTIMFLV